MWEKTKAELGILYLFLQTYDASFQTSLCASAG
jgi:hypothetical protein